MDIRDKIKKIILEIEDLEGDLDLIQGLISRSYLDSYAVLMLVSALEKNFDLKIQFDESFIQKLDTVDAIENLIRSQSV
jgi:acyl carrier protein